MIGSLGRRLGVGARARPPDPSSEALMVVCWQPLRMTTRRQVPAVDGDGERLLCTAFIVAATATINGAPLPALGSDLIDHARAPCPQPDTMIGITDPGQADTGLTTGTPTCPSCLGPPQPWGRGMLGPAACATTARPPWPCDRDGSAAAPAVAHERPAARAATSWNPSMRRTAK
jgi:hypothetical protein